MTADELAKLSDQALLQEAKRARSVNLVNAVLIGFLVGILVYSAVYNRLGLVSLIPLFLAYKLVNKSKPDSKELESLLKERKLS